MCRRKATIRKKHSERKLLGVAVVERRAVHSPCWLCHLQSVVVSFRKGCSERWDGQIACVRNAISVGIRDVIRGQTQEPVVSLMRSGFTADGTDSADSADTADAADIFIKAWTHNAGDRKLVYRSSDPHPYAIFYGALQRETDRELPEKLRLATDFTT